MTIEPDDKRLRFVAVDKATSPPGGYLQHIKDHWWIVHPEKGLVFYQKEMFPQCNSNKALSEDIQRRMYPWAEIKFMPSVFRPVNPNDWLDR